MRDINDVKAFALKFQLFGIFFFKRFIVSKFYGISFVE